MLLWKSRYPNCVRSSASRTTRWCRLFFKLQDEIVRPFSKKGQAGKKANTTVYLLGVICFLRSTGNMGKHLSVQKFAVFRENAGQGEARPKRAVCAPKINTSLQVRKQVKPRADFEKTFLKRLEQTQGLLAQAIVSNRLSLRLPNSSVSVVAQHLSEVLCNCSQSVVRL